jgi:hypothetical protein
MNTRYDIHRELFQRLREAQSSGGNPCGEHSPGINAQAVLSLERASIRVCEYYEYPESRDGMRTAAMDAAVAAIRLMYSIDDALS